MVVRRRAARDFEQVGRRLCEVLDGVALEGFPRHSVSVRYATEHRCGVVVHGPGLSGAVSGTDPLKDGRRLMRCEPMDDSAEAAFSARVTQAASDAFRRHDRVHVQDEAHGSQNPGASYPDSRKLEATGRVSEGVCVV